MKLTKEQTDKYVADPFHCPFCDSDEIISREFDTASAEVDVRCYSCRNKWTEIYELKTIKNYEQQ